MTYVVELYAAYQEYLPSSKVAASLARPFVSNAIKAR